MWHISHAPFKLIMRCLHMLLFPVLPKQKLLNCFKDFTVDGEEAEAPSSSDNLWKEYLSSIRIAGNSVVLIANAVKKLDP
jgi:hypothetical protein